MMNSSLHLCGLHAFVNLNFIELLLTERLIDHMVREHVYPNPDKSHWNLCGGEEIKKPKIYKDSFVGGEGHFVEQCIDQLVYLLGIPRIISYSLL